MAELWLQNTEIWWRAGGGGWVNERFPTKVGIVYDNRLSESTATADGRPYCRLAVLSLGALLYSIPKQVWEALIHLPCVANQENQNYFFRTRLRMKEKNTL